MNHIFMKKDLYLLHFGENKRVFASLEQMFVYSMHCIEVIGLGAVNKSIKIILTWLFTSFY